MAKRCFKSFANTSRQPVNAPEFILSPCVESELGAIWARVATDDPDAATRVIELAFETFATLAREPGSGRLRKFRRSRLKNIRSWHIPGLDNYMVFYRSIPRGIQVLHVFQGARNIETLFEQSVLSSAISRRPAISGASRFLEESIPVHVLVPAGDHADVLTQSPEVSFSDPDDRLSKTGVVTMKNHEDIYELGRSAAFRQ